MLKKISLKLKPIILILFSSMYLTFVLLKFFSNVYLSSFYIILDIPINFDVIIYYTKLLFPFTTFISSVILIYSFYITYLKVIQEKSVNSKKLIKKQTSQIPIILNSNFQILLGTDEYMNNIYLNEPALYQNLLITGAIGSGKTSSAIYPLISGLIGLNTISGLVLDVKGNMYYDILQICKTNNKENLLTVIELDGLHTYNPLHKPNLKPYILANRLVTILTLFSNKNNSDTYWFDKAQNLLTECIKLSRLYNNGYVTFTDIHNIITSKDFLNEKLEFVKKRFLENKLSKLEQFDFSSLLSYFKNEFINLDSKILSIILSEISRITSIFVSDIDIQNTFCPKKENITFTGFENMFENNSLILLKMNIGKYQNLSKIIAAYLKLDFQTEVLQRPFPIATPTFFVCDEYQEYVTDTDANFFSLSREYKCINIISTQSYSSLLSTLKVESTLNVLVQNFINKLFLRTDDIYTIESAQKLFGKQDKTKLSNSVSENAQETNYSYLLNIMKSKKSNISQTISSYSYIDNCFDSKDFSQNLKIFEAIAYLSNGSQMLPPFKLLLKPYFKEVQNIEKSNY